MGCNGTKKDWHVNRRWQAFRACVSMGYGHFEGRRDPYILVHFGPQPNLRDVGVAGSNPVTPTNDSWVRSGQTGNGLFRAHR